MEKIKVYTAGVKATFETWIAERGGVKRWRNQNLSNPGAGDMFTPHYGADGVSTLPPKWTHGDPTIHLNIEDFIFVKEMKEVKRFHVAVRRVELSLKLTDASTRRVRKECEKAGEDAVYIFDYETQEAVIQVPVWEESEGRDTQDIANREAEAERELNDAIAR